MQLLLQPDHRANVVDGTFVDDSPSIKTRVLFCVIVLILTTFALMTHYLTPLEWNVAATRAAQSLTSSTLREVMRLISGFGNAPKVIAITALALFICNRPRQAVFLTLSGLGGWVIAIQLKHVFHAPRPAAELVSVFHQWPDGSFPSGHLVFYVCYFGFLFFIAREELPRASMLRRSLMVLTAGLAILVGFSRVYLGEHWTSDLPGSYLLGGLWLALCLKFYRAWVRARAPQNDWFLPYRTIEK